MSFTVGQTVVHPHHGTAVIDNKEERDLNGETAEYLVLTASDPELVVKVPVDACDEIGIRSVIEESEIDEVLDVLKEDPSIPKGHWSRRLKRNQKRLRSGDPREAAIVLRNLTAKLVEKGRLSPAEKRLHDSARRLICGEISAVIGNEDETEKMVDEALEPILAAAEDEDED